MTVSPVGQMLCFTRESFRERFNGRDPVQEGFAESKMQIAGRERAVFKVWEGPKDVWKINEEDHFRIAHLTEVADG
eukprot:10613609-Alexandrium_andersonii.AAC.1